MKPEYQQYLAHGFALCDIPPGTKGPAAKNWNLKGAAFHGRNGAGLCHAFSGTCALDIDDYSRACGWFAERGVDLASLLGVPEHVGISSGKANRAKLLFRLAGPLASLSLCPYKAPSKTDPTKQETFHAVELRCATKDGKSVQDVLPPSVHPEVLRPYEWSYGDNLDAHWSNIPPIPPALEALWREALAVDAPAAPLQAAAPQTARYAAMQSWLNTQDPDLPYDEWVKVGARIHHETQGADEGLRMFDLWSQRGKKYGTTKDGRAAQMPRDKWKSYDSTKPNAATFGGALRDQVAAPTDFAVVEPTEPGVDTRAQSAMVEILEKRLVLVRSLDSYYDLDTSAAISDKAVRHVFCPDLPTIKKEGKDGEIKYARPDPIKHLQYSKTKVTVEGVGMHPGAPRIYTDSGTRYVNSYVPQHPQLLQPNAQEKEVLAFLWSRIADPLISSWLAKFFGHMVQKPGVKIRAAPLLISAETGTGKNTIMRVMPEILFGAKYVRTMSGDVLGGQFNGPLGSTWWLYLEELQAGTNKADRTRVTNKLKGWITDDALEIHMKGKEPFEIRNRVQPGATSNFDNALALDNNDRRWAISEMLDKPLTPQESADIYDFLLSPRAPGVLRQVFLNTDIAGFDPSARAPESGAKRTMISASLGAWESQLIDLMVNRAAPFDRDLFTLQDVLASLPNSSVSSVGQLGRLLRQKPFRCAPVRKAMREKRYWAWINIALWEARTEGERAEHVASGRYPFGTSGWANKIPRTLLAMSPECGVDSDAEPDNSDLL
jgi:hypothetical protein